MGSVVSSSVPVNSTQQQAKSMSQQYLASKPAGGKATIYDTDVTAIKDIASFLGNQANQTYNERYEKQLKDAQYNQQQAASDKLSTDRTAFERQQQLMQQQSKNQPSLLQQGSVAGSGSGGSNSRSSVNYDYMKFQNDLESKLIKDKAEAERTVVQQQGQNQLNSINTQAFANDRTNWFNSYDQTRQASLNRGFQASESAAELASRERMQGMDALSKIYSSMFNSFSGGGNQNYQYWGGKV